MDNREVMRDQFLKHYGILGMKWGFRKRKVKKAATSSSQNQNGTTQRRMSNKELSARIKRLELEQRYAKLTEVPKPKTVSRIDKLVKTAGTVAQLSGSAATIYKNLNDLGLVNKTK